MTDFPNTYGNNPESTVFGQESGGSFPLLQKARSRNTSVICASLWQFKLPKVFGKL